MPTRIETRWVRVIDGKTDEARYRVRMYSAVELRALLLQAGFSDVQLYGDLDGRPYDRNARRLHAVARR